MNCSRWIFCLLDAICNESQRKPKMFSLAFLYVSNVKSRLLEQ